jgi:hypothetical protein
LTSTESVEARAAHLRRAAILLLALCCGLIVFPVAAQQLEPRSYSPSPVGVNFLGLALLDSRGGVVLDASLPIDDVNAQIEMAVPYYGRTFALFGRSASVSAVVPYAWGTVDGLVFEERQSIRRSGFGDPQFRLAVNLLGGPAMTPREFAARKRVTTLGVSLVVSCPLGEYFPDKLINLGANRWSAKPEIGLSQPVGPWDLELYAGAYLFTANDDFYGGQRREQAPLGTVQTHVVRTFRPRTWVAFDFTYYWGGETTIGGVRKNDRQGNTRGGITAAIPVGAGQSLKLTWARGVSTRVGSSFQTFGVAWQWMWFARRG